MGSSPNGSHGAVIIVRLVVVGLWTLVLFASGDLSTGADWVLFPLSAIFMLVGGVRLVQALMERGGEQG